MNRNTLKTLCLATVVSAGVVTFAMADEFEIIRWTMDGGGVMRATGGDLEVSGTIGQPDASNVMTGGNIEVTGGFWFSAIAGDCNEDSSVDVFDYDVFGDCVTGPDGEVANECRCFDFDQDGDVDLIDFALFQQLFTGPL